MVAGKVLRARPTAQLNAPMQEAAGPASELCCPGAWGASGIFVGSARTSGKLRTSSAQDFSCGTFPAFKLLYGNAVKQPLPARAILLQAEQWGNGWCPLLWAAQR